MKTTYEFQGVKYLLGSAGSLILACPKCGEEHFREPENYFWSLVPKNKAWLDKGQKNYWGDPSWHKCMTCKTQMEPIMTDELESRWKPFWRSLGHKVTESSNALGQEPCAASRARSPEPTGSASDPYHHD